MDKRYFYGQSRLSLSTNRGRWPNLASSHRFAALGHGRSTSAQRGTPVLPSTLTHPSSAAPRLGSRASIHSFTSTTFTLSPPLPGPSSAGQQLGSQASSRGTNTPGGSISVAPQAQCDTSPTSASSASDSSCDSCPNYSSPSEHLDSSAESETDTADEEWVHSPTSDSLDSSDDSEVEDFSPEVWLFKDGKISWATSTEAMRRCNPPTWSDSRCNQPDNGY